MSIFASSLKSKSHLLIAIWQISGSPHNGATSIDFVSETICGNPSKLLELLKVGPDTWASVALPILIKSCGVKENSPISDKSKSKCLSEENIIRRLDELINYKFIDNLKNKKIVDVDVDVDHQAGAGRKKPT